MIYQGIWNNHELIITEVLLHVVGKQVEIQYTAVRVHVPGKYYTVHTLQQQTEAAVVIVL